MLGTPSDAAEFERELARLAYSRPMDGVDPIAAQAQLAAIAESRRRPPEIEWQVPKLPATIPRGYRLAVAAAVVAALVGASLSASAPVASLAIFDRPQSGAPAWPGTADQGERADKIRWLASSNGWDVFGFITNGGNICLTSFEGTESAGGACTSQKVFATTGLRMGMRRVTGDNTQYLSVSWGPTGGVRLSGVPVPIWKLTALRR